MKKFLKILICFIIVLVIVAVSLFTLNDNRPLEETGYYAATNSKLNVLKTDGGYGSGLKGGWNKENISPAFEIYIAGYGLRRNPASGVHDSIYVRSVVLDNSKEKVAMITMDLLIAPPLVADLVIPALGKLGFSRKNIYFSATHSHSSAGGWAGGPGGRVMAGPRNERMIKTIADAIVRSVKKSESNASPCKIGFQKINAGAYVRNRLFGETAAEDPWLRLMKIEKEDKESAMILTYAAHATNLPRQDNQISADYPGMLVAKLETAGLCNFAAFFAGAVGSMGPTLNPSDSYKKVDFISSGLTDLIKAHRLELKTDTSSLIQTAWFPLTLRDPQMRISKYLRIRPWVFNWLMGKQEVGINALRIGNMIWIGTPCDYSGMLYNSPDSAAQKIGKDLIITSFNGGYVGYITPDQYYDEHKAETQEMNWFGPYNGRYFKEVMIKLIEKVGRHSSHK